MKRLQSCQKVVLLLGSCRKFGDTPSVESPNCDTERVAKSLELLDYKVLLLDLRQTCRRDKRGGGCNAFGTVEVEMLLKCVAININVALNHYNIGIVSVVSFAETWWHSYSKLCYIEKRLLELPHFHIDTHLGWFGKTAARASVRQQSQVMTSSFKELSRQLSAANILPFEAKQIYQGF